MKRLAPLLLSLLLSSLPRAMQAAPSADDSALLLADQTPEAAPAPASDWRHFIEAGIGASRGSDGRRETTQRLSLDVQTDRAIFSDLRLIFANRLDLNGPGHAERAINTLKEAYLGWRLDDQTLVDAGRINVRNGVASGYNPTDYFRSGAVRSVVSIDPASLRENRQGSIMLRAQRLWDSASLSAAFAPDLHRPANGDGLNLDLGATNRQDRLLLAFSPTLAPAFTPQFLLYHESRQAPQVGLNLTALANDRTVTYLEWSGGRRASLLTRATTPSAPATAWYNQLAAGLAYTTPSKLTLTAEYHWHGDALSSSEWHSLRQGAPASYGRYRSYLQEAQAAPTRQAIFAHARWQDAFRPGLDLSLMHNLDLVDHSRRHWLEARYHQGQWEYALQWQAQYGAPLTSFAVPAESRSWQAVLRYYP